MKKDRIATALMILLAGSTLGTALVGYQYLKAAQQMQFMQAETARIGQRQLAMQALAVDLNDYARRNPAIDPLLDQLNLRLRPATIAAPVKP